MRRGQTVTWIAVWAVGAAVAVLVAWLGVRAVLGPTTGPLVPEVDPSPASVAVGSGAPASPGSGGTAPAGTRSPGGPSPGGPSAGGPSAGAAGSRRHGAAPTPTPAAGSPGEHAYSLAGGHVMLRITRNRCSLMSETPDGGYTSQNWSSMGWLRVDFNRNGNEESSLICHWYEQAPTVTIGS